MKDIRTLRVWAMTQLAPLAQLAAPDDCPLDVLHRDVEMLLQHVTGMSAVALYAHPETELDEARVAGFKELIQRRLQHEPLAHLIGWQAFFEHEFLVTPSVLIPRPETELLVEAALRHLAQHASVQTLIDVGVGSGAIILSVLAAVPRCVGVGVDVSEAALAVAQENAMRLGVSERVTFVQNSCADCLRSNDASTTLIVSNPPYVSAGDTLPTSVREYEPAQALFAGEDGMDVIEQLLDEQAALIRSGASLLLEIGAGQADRVSSAVAKRGLPPATFLNDLQGIPRVVQVN